MIKKQRNGFFVPRIIICVILTMVIMSNCDTLEDDAIEPVTALTTGQGRAVLDGQSTVIDIKSTLAINAPVKTEIVRFPSYGTLSSLGEGLYKYSSDENASGKQDVIGYTVSDLNDKILLSDSILIDIVDELPDSCQLVAIPDIVNVLSDSLLVVDVLSNDYVCDSLRPIQVSIVKAPQFGNARVVNNEVVYQGVNLSQTDELVYQITGTKNDQLSSLATVTFFPTDSVCVWQVINDSFNYSSVTGSEQFDVLANDQLCDESAIEIGIVQNPTKGQAYFDENYVLNYLLNDTYPAGDSDSLVYQVCINNECKSALVQFSLFSNSCDSLSLNDDYFDYNAVQEVQFFEVLANDQLCNSDKAIEISVVDGPFNGEAVFDANYTLNYFYATGNADSLRYQVCLGGECRTAMVRFSLTDSNCDTILMAVDDVYSVPDSTQNSFQVSLNVISNDILCGDYFIDIEVAPNVGTAEINGTTILYTTNATNPSNDSFQYRLCSPNDDVCDVANVTIER